MQVIDPKGSFLKNLVLSVLLLVLSSLLIPIVLKQIDDRKAVDQLRIQDEVSRQDTILDAQAALLDTMATDFWTYEFYASDLVISRDPHLGQDAWHARAVATYYQNTGPLLGKMRAEISTLLRLAPRATYDAFLTFYQDQVVPLDSCLLELMKREQTNPPRETQPMRCAQSKGQFAGASWDTLANSIVQNDLAGDLDRQFAALADVFRLQGTPTG
jgi:hypothetical protein